MEIRAETGRHVHRRAIRRILIRNKVSSVLSYDANRRGNVFFLTRIFLVNQMNQMNKKKMLLKGERAFA